MASFISIEAGKAPDVRPMIFFRNVAAPALLQIRFLQDTGCKRLQVDSNHSQVFDHEASHARQNNHFAVLAFDSKCW